METRDDRFDQGHPNINYPETPPRVKPQEKPPRVKPPAPPVPPTPRVDPHNGPASKTQSKNRNFRSVAQEAMLRCATVAQMKLSPKHLSSRRLPIEMINGVLNEEQANSWSTATSRKIQNIANSMRHPTANNWDVSPKECQEKRRAPTPYILSGVHPYIGGQRSGCRSRQDRQ